MLRQRTHRKWNQAVRCSAAPVVPFSPACIEQAPQRERLAARSRQPAQAFICTVQNLVQKTAAIFCFVTS